MIDLSGFGEMGEAIVSGMKTLKTKINEMEDPKLKKQLNSLIIGSVVSVNNTDITEMNNIIKTVKKIKKDVIKKYKL